MAGSKAIGSGEVLTFKDGTIVDETLFENNPLDETFHEVNNVSIAEDREKFKRLFPDREYPEPTS